MEKQISLNRQLKWGTAFLLVLFLNVFTFYGCASQKPQSQTNVAQFRFSFNDKTYRIRSINSEDNAQSYNDLIGENFVAADYDQDRILDRVVLGEVSLNVAQQIYEYGLDRLTAENKLQVRVLNIDRYVHENNAMLIEIRSYQPDNAKPFNEFVITDNRSLLCSEVTIVIDRDADGILEEVLKGSISLEKAQSQYEVAIKAGLQRGELVKSNQTILARKK